eukprot:TRINITY_DN56301_c0_g1_i1.p1 TRINITY_DN56301_c0_g1~~TRINITY_DN56301_c0_g1_i1.p1  ORF type:complete len:415 (-),score=37.37 TRINITY_DN56301_c0_g1_i1:165-1361(-)
MEGATGVVKSFGLAKGFGFIQSDAVQCDIFFPKHALPSDLVDALEANCFDLATREVSFSIEEKGGKPQAHAVQLVPREGGPLVGKVKSFIPAKGYGFICAEALEGQDIFFMKIELPSHLQSSTTLSGTPVSFCMVQTPEGKLQAQRMRIGNLGKAAAAAPAVFDASAFAGMDPFHWGLALMSGQLQPPGLTRGAEGSRTRGNRGKPPSSGQKLIGTIKSFNQMKGWGFISSRSYGGDIYFKSDDGTIFQGMQVSFIVTIMPDGQVQGRNLVAVGQSGTPTRGLKRPNEGGGLSFTPFAAGDWAGLSDLPAAKRSKLTPDRPDLIGGQCKTGFIKSYHVGNGWGFINCAGIDVYFKGSSLPPGAQEQPNLVGSPVTFEINTMLDGKLQAKPGIILGDRY